jgi:hypothetical protein
MLTLHRITTKAPLRSLPPVSPWAKPWRQKARLLSALAAGGIVTQRDLIDAMWGDDPEGGPLDADGIMRQHIYSLRQRDYPIRNYPKLGYELR